MDQIIGFTHLLCRLSMQAKKKKKEAKQTLYFLLSHAKKCWIERRRIVRSHSCCRYLLFGISNQLVRYLFIYFIGGGVLRLREAIW
jgi:hypothetical protein